MYVTRPISRYFNNPQAAAEPPPEGPGSGILVVEVEDEEVVELATCCWGLCRELARGRQVYGLPLPQNRKLTVEYRRMTTTTSSTGGTTTTTSTDRDDVVFVPVLGQPLSSNRYYVVLASGKHTGYVRTRG